MSETNDNVTPIPASPKLADAVRAVKNAAADRDDVVVDLRDAERMRLELLASELASVIAEVPADLDLFDFAISSGLQPRFWVDVVSHVAMGRDKRSYRFVKDTRNGRVVLAESPDLRPIADQVTRYVAERMVERERMLEGSAPTSYKPAQDRPAAAVGTAETMQSPTDVAQGTAPSAGPETAGAGRQSSWRAVLWGLAIFMLGGLFGFSIMATQWWEEISRRVGSL